jgi:hypothetical protein
VNVTCEGRSLGAPLLAVPFKAPTRPIQLQVWQLESARRMHGQSSSCLLKTCGNSVLAFGFGSACSHCSLPHVRKANALVEFLPGSACALATADRTRVSTPERSEIATFDPRNYSIQETRSW